MLENQKAPATLTGTQSVTDFEDAISAKYTEDQQAVLRFWFYGARKNQWSQSRIATITGVSATSISRVNRGIYGTDASLIIEKLRKAQETYQESSDNPDFIETSLANRLFTIFDKTRALRNVSILWGRLGIGKSECVAEYQRRNNHGRTVVVRFPAGSTFTLFIFHVARACGIQPRGNSWDIRNKIISVLSAGQRLLIIDELHQAFLTARTDTAVKCIEFLREVCDKDGANCGLVLIGTEVLEEHVFRGPHMKRSSSSLTGAPSRSRFPLRPPNGTIRNSCKPTVWISRIRKTTPTPPPSSRTSSSPPACGSSRCTSATGRPTPPSARRNIPGTTSPPPSKPSSRFPNDPFHPPNIMKLLMNKLPTTSQLLSTCYERGTNNHPELGVTHLGSDARFRPELKAWNEPSWEIYRFPGGHVVVAANRPSKKEVIAGELNGRWGSYISLAQVSRPALRNALRIARGLCVVPTRRTLLVPRDSLIGIAEICTDLNISSI